MVFAISLAVLALLVVALREEEQRREREEASFRHALRRWVAREGGDGRRSG